MNSPLQLPITKDNLHAAITAFLYSISAIPDSLIVTDIHIHKKECGNYQLTLYNQEEEVELRYF